MVFEECTFRELESLINKYNLDSLWSMILISEMPGKYLIDGVYKIVLSGQIIGLLDYQHSDMYDGIEISLFEVLKKRNGHGKKIIEYFLKFVVLGKPVYLIPQNEGSKIFWEKLGFISSGEEMVLHYVPSLK
ncbi:GNAT family N-acetyltransferase [Paenibacillus terrae]|uniref:N-acetyltransferase domain-containing protein n=1 Tax=Paenibacillus terrae TaxID=159743 RepID=A0A0D7WY14_9BACL|nr:GNAT family N-acetyltransferase [Paenibacillus terrae]KJD43618.1 hypothetical protein QD47_21750 [Paenibacillus terrae]